MPIFSDDTAAHRGPARPTPSSARCYSSARPGAEQSVHAYPSQGLMPPAQYGPGPDVRTPHSRSRDFRLANVDPGVLDAAETLMIMRNGGAFRHQEVSQNRLPALPSVERDERSINHTRVTSPRSIAMRTPDLPRSESSRIRFSPYELPPLSGFQPPPFQSPEVAYAQPPHVPIKQEPGSDIEMPMSSLAPKRTLRPLIDLSQSSEKKFPGAKVVRMGHPLGSNGQPCNVLSAIAFKIGAHSIPLDKVELAQIGYDDMELDVATPEIVLTINWPGYPAKIGSIQKVVRAVQGTYTEVAIAYAVSTMVEELETRVFNSGATIQPRFQACEVNKKATTRNLCITHLYHCFQNVYQPLLWIC
ncbi:hypothetical protein BD410DRAFT_836228 [Rickenella mellea]|uniref:Uncharacterized protein n=1 Tax=Rickenella mellea TaxID=50990 RepID=A0A4Y7QIA9_9AGAM|nr:hypothetical protein BD410DRAFT_836228 [Rickenella mellea]